MRWNGKITGLILGLVSGHPLGLILGVVIGHLFDIGFFSRILQKNLTGNTQSIQKVFFDCTFAVMGFVAKADGRVSESEIRAAELIMQQMELGPELKREAIKLFNQGKQPDFDLHTTIQRLRTSCWRQPNLLRTFLETQIQIANAGGKISQEKAEALRSIWANLGLRGFAFEQFGQKEYTRRHYQQEYQPAYASTELRLRDAYQTLNIAVEASDADVKKAYRRLLSQNHPDKLMSQGLPPEMIKLANERTQKIKSAYETIKDTRGL